MSKRIVTFGDVIDDIVVVPQGPVRADTDTHSTIRVTPGGSAANTAAWLASLGVGVDLVGRVGAADLERHHRDLAGAGITPHLSADTDLPTGRIVIVVEKNSRTMFTDKGANVNLTPDAVTDALLADAAVLHVGGYSVMHDPEGVRRLLGRARAAGTAVSLDPSSAGFLADFGVARFFDVVGGADILLPNLDEGRMLAGVNDPLEVVRALSARFGVVALTLGEDGCLVTAPGVEPTLVEAVPATLVDPTGAGDSFSAGFLAEWVASRDPVAAARAGVAVAARAVAVIGARPVSAPGS